MRGRLTLGLLGMVLMAACAGGGVTATTSATTVGSVESTPETTSSTTTPAVEPGGDELAGLVASGRVAVDAVSAEGGVSGRIITMQATNLSTGEVVVTIPCGLVFEPAPGVGEQRMMVVQRASARLAAGGQASLTPYTMCIDQDLDAASPGAVYSVGSLAPDDLRKLAECVCERDLEAEIGNGFLADIGLQIAVWTVSSGHSMEDQFGPLAEELEGFDPAELEGMPGFEGLLDVLKDPMAASTKWLKDCGIDPPA